MSIDKRIETLAALGNYFNNIVFHFKNKNTEDNPDFQSVDSIIRQAQIENSWFTEDNLLFALQSWSKVLTEKNLKQWVKTYNLEHSAEKVIGLVTAGNIPLVGLHDMLCVWLSGHNLLIKPSSQDRKLTKLVVDFLNNFSIEFKNQINITEQKLQGFDAIIATGSNNTALYFETYFGKYPHIIRKNRNAVAVLSGNESENDLQNLADDIFMYFGLGCRNVSKIFIPINYDLDHIFRAIYPKKDIIHHHKYKNNYDYNKAVYLMSGENLLENGFVLFKEDSQYASPIAVVFYEYYNDLESLKQRLNQDKDQIQCVVGAVEIPNIVPFGKAQQPELWDYADGVDTLQFLSEL